MHYDTSSTQPAASGYLQSFKIDIKYWTAGAGQGPFNANTVLTDHGQYVSVFKNVDTTVKLMNVSANADV